MPTPTLKFSDFDAPSSYQLNAIEIVGNNDYTGLNSRFAGNGLATLFSYLRTKTIGDGDNAQIFSSYQAVLYTRTDALSPGCDDAANEDGRFRIFVNGSSAPFDVVNQNFTPGNFFDAQNGGVLDSLTLAIDQTVVVVSLGGKWRVVLRY